MIYLTDGLVDFTLTSLSGAAFYTIECTGNACYHYSSSIIVVKILLFNQDCLISCVVNLGGYLCTLLTTTYG